MQSRVYRECMDILFNAHQGHVKIKSFNNFIRTRSWGFMANIGYSKNHYDHVNNVQGSLYWYPKNNCNKKLRRKYKLNPIYFFSLIN